MLSVPIPASATKDILLRRDRKRACVSILLGMATVLFVFGVPAGAQAGPQFNDLAARAAQARDAGNLTQAVELYRQATAAKPARMMPK